MSTIQWFTVRSQLKKYRTSNSKISISIIYLQSIEKYSTLQQQAEIMLEHRKKNNNRTHIMHKLSGEMIKRALLL